MDWIKQIDAARNSRTPLFHAGRSKIRKAAAYACKSTSFSRMKIIAGSSVGFVYSMWGGNGCIKWAALISNVDNNRVENKRGRGGKRKRKENKKKTSRGGDHLVWAGTWLVNN